MKRMTAILLTMVMMISAAQSASALMTTEEKSKQYQNAILELEAYLESPNSSGESLYGILNVFQSLGRFEQSQSLNYYTVVLIKLYEETYDFEMMSDLELLELDQRFQSYLNDEMKGSPLCSVAELKGYAAARKKQHGGDTDGAMESYKTCMSYFDASERYLALRKEKYGSMYDRAMALQNDGDLAGAYALFAAIAPFEDSENRMLAIEVMLGYKPASATDNLFAVTGVKAKTVRETQITLQWNASESAEYYEVLYRKSGSDEWLSAGETEKTELKISGLKAATAYDLCVNAFRGKAKAAGETVILKTSARARQAGPTPAPTYAYDFSPYNIWVGPGGIRPTNTWTTIYNTPSPTP